MPPMSAVSASSASRATPQLFDKADRAVSGGASTLEQYVKKCDDVLTKLKLTAVLSSPTEDAPNDAATIRVLAGQIAGVAAKTMVSIQEFPIECLPALQQALLGQQTAESDLIQEFPDQQQLVIAHKTRSAHWVLPHTKNYNHYVAYPTWIDQKDWTLPASVSRKSKNLFPTIDRLLVKEGTVRLERIVTRVADNKQSSRSLFGSWLKKAMTTQSYKDAAKMKRSAVDVRRRVFARSLLTCTLPDISKNKIKTNIDNDMPAVVAAPREIVPPVPVSAPVEPAKKEEEKEPEAVPEPEPVPEPVSREINFVPVTETISALPSQPIESIQEEPEVEPTTPVVGQEPIQYPPILSTQPDVGAEEDAESVVSGVSAVSGVSGVQLTKQLSASSIASPTTTAVAPHHQEIANLIKHLDPSQEEFTDMLLAQFRGREDELLESLQQMQEETKAETMEAAPPMVAA